MTMAILVLSLFGTVWFEWGASFRPDGVGIWAFLPVIVVPALLMAQRMQIHGSVDGTNRRHARRVFAATSAGEATLLLVFLWYLSKTGHSNLAPYMVAVIVALHFLPAAYFTPAHRYYGTAFAMITLVGMTLATLPEQSFVICFGAALILWGTAASLAFFPPSPSKVERFSTTPSRASDGPSDIPDRDERWKE